MIDVPRALRALSLAGIDHMRIAQDLYISPYIVSGWAAGHTISDASLDRLARYVAGLLRAANACPDHRERRLSAALRTAYDALTVDPDDELIANVRATMRTAGSLIGRGPLIDIDETVRLAAEADRLLASFRHPDHELHDRIDWTFS